MFDKGIVYIVFESNDNRIDIVKELNHSASSVKKFHPDLHITLFTDGKLQGLNKQLFDNIEIVPVTGKRIKQQILSRSPYIRTLYLDCDTGIVNPFVDVFKLLDRFDVAAVIDHMRVVKSTSYVWGRYYDVPEAFPEFGGGVFLFKKSKSTNAFFDIWQRNYEEWCRLSGKYNDQPSFRVTLWECDFIKVYSLPIEFNIRTKKNNNITPKVYHYHNMFNNQPKGDNLG